MSRRVLILDDDADTLEMMASLLDDTMTVVTAKNIKQAVDLIKQEYVHVVISDVNLGSENGFQLIEELQSNLVEIPFIIVSGDITPEKEARAKQLGAIGTLEKPFHYEDLMKIINYGLDPIRRLRESKARRMARAA